MGLWRGWSWAREDIDMLSLLKDHDFYREGDTSTQLNLAIGWRRQHAVTVWNAMAAVVMVAVVHSIGDHERKEAAVKAYYDGLEDFFKYR